jgi:hypothetical protein
LTGIPLEQLDQLLVVERFQLDAVDCPVRYDVWREFAIRGPDFRPSLLVERTDASRAPGTSQIATALTRRAEDARSWRERHKSPRFMPRELRVTYEGGIAPSENNRGSTEGRTGALAFGEWILAEADLFEVLTVLLPLTEWANVVAVLAEHDREELARLLHPPSSAVASATEARVTVPQGDDHDRRSWLARVLVRLWGFDPDLDTEREVGAAELKRQLQGIVQAPVPRHLSQAGWAGAIATINLDRRGRTATEHSIRAVKADAARSLFSIDCSHLTWAVIDSGIDARHPAFSAAGPDGGFETQVTLTLDFTQVASQRHFAELRDATSFVDAVNELATVQPPRASDDTSYTSPFGSHGTHVAGILAGGAVTDAGPPIGVAPKLNLWDLRVVDDYGELLEHRVILALQYIREFNRLARSSHGVAGTNISLSIPYDPRAHACGWTPVCSEVRRLVRSGVVVVTAAGNAGFDRESWKEGDPGRGFSTVGITDPGNTEEAITVGATHRFEAYRYGASYFSSKGPTADGRMKPDLVAPGEHIVSAVGRSGTSAKDGTSQAAPHVSGAAALLMARHAELKSEPERIKAVLCSNATSLARDRYFQGAGMLDILRAIQAV